MSQVRILSPRPLILIVFFRGHLLTMNSSVRSSRRFDRRLYLGASLIFLALVFWTFARTFYLKPFFGTPPLSALLHIHGVVMSGWVVLLVVHTSLIAAHRVR